MYVNYYGHPWQLVKLREQMKKAVKEKETAEVALEGEIRAHEEVGGGGSSSSNSSSCNQISTTV